MALKQVGPSPKLKSQTDLSRDTAQESSPKSCGLPHLSLQPSSRNINRRAEENSFPPPGLAMLLDKKHLLPRVRDPLPIKKKQ